MDETRKLLLASCRQLIKVQSRINSLYWTPKKYPNGQWETIPTWQVKDLDPPSPWLEGCPSNTAIGGAGECIALVITHLLAMVESDQPIDPKHVCIVLQHLTAEGMGSWGGAAKRFAKRTGLQLPENAWDWHHGLSLQHRPLAK